MARTRRRQQVRRTGIERGLLEPVVESVMEQADGTRVIRLAPQVPPDGDLTHVRRADRGARRIKPRRA
jgi:hypothetical protein